MKMNPNSWFMTKFLQRDSSVWDREPPNTVCELVWLTAKTTGLWLLGLILGLTFLYGNLLLVLWGVGRIDKTTITGPNELAVLVSVSVWTFVIMIPTMMYVFDRQRSLTSDESFLGAIVNRVKDKTCVIIDYTTDK